ncbi:Fic family protein [Pseudomonas sp. IAP-CY TE4608]
MKALFHTLESLGSARIEGNHTTLADYIDSKVEGKAESTDQLLEIANIEKAMDYRRGDQAWCRPDRAYDPRIARHDRNGVTA